MSACARELEALADALEESVDAWVAQGLVHKPTLQRRPGRCVIQVGPVAVSFTWLAPRTDDMGAGELLVAIWEGVIGAKREHQFERVQRVPLVSAAHELMEEVYHPGVVSTDSWRWLLPDQVAETGLNASELAARSVARLRSAYDGIAANSPTTTEAQ